MAVYFFDTSGIVKRYVNETGTAWVLGTVAPSASHRSYLACVTAVEVVSAIVRRQRSGNLSAGDAAVVWGQFRHDLEHEYRVIEITPTLIADAMALAETHALRGYDAVQLAAAKQVHTESLALGTACTLVSADFDLNVAAAAEGLAVEDPNTHP